MPLIYQTTVSTQVAAQNRYEQWLTPMITDFELLPPDIYQRQDFMGRVRSLVQASHEIHDVDTNSFGGYISERKANTGYFDKLALLYVVKGNIRCSYKKDKDILVNPGEFLLFDTRLANQTQFINSRFIQLNLPRSCAINFLTDKYLPSQLSHMISSSGLADMLALQLKLFNSLSDNLSNAEKLVFLQSTQDLATSLINCLYKNQKNTDCLDRNSIYLAAVRYIENNLALDSLSPESIAHALACSRSTLYRAFAAQNLYPADYIRDQRLQKLAQLLQQSNQGLPIAQLASECGLYDAPNLSRLFKRKFGLSPQEYRANY